MKTSLLLTLALLAAAPVSAQMHRPEAGRGAASGESRGPDRRPESPARPHGDNVRRDRTSVSVGFYGGYYPRRDFVGFDGCYGPGYFGSVGWYDAPYGYYSSVPYGTVAYSGYERGPGSYASDGFWLGALAGGIIGHNSGSLGHNGWRGAAWGAGLGWLLGSVADAHRRPTTVAAPVIATAPAAPVVAPAPAPEARAYVATPAAGGMAAANGLFGR